MRYAHAFMYMGLIFVANWALYMATPAWIA
jgi:hypothetical protein